MAAIKKTKIISGKTKKNARRKGHKPDLFISIKSILQQAQGSAYKAVNSLMVIAYWHIGRLIVENEQQGKHKAEYGKAVLQELSDRLNKEFKTGYSIQNLRSFRQFYLVFPEIRSTVWSESPEDKSLDTATIPAINKKIPIRSTVWSESAEARILSIMWSKLSWSQYKLLMRIESSDARAYYIKEAVEQNWGVRGLERQINSFYYERILSSKNKKAVKKEKSLLPILRISLKIHMYLSFCK
jgi:predicted nuclease of restriction endonuclease-like (RecB) superfamily